MRRQRSTALRSAISRRYGNSEAFSPATHSSTFERQGSSPFSETDPSIMLDRNSTMDDGMDYDRGEGDYDGETNDEMRGFYKTNIKAFDDMREKMYAVVENDRFQTLVVVMISINSIMMGVSTYLPTEDDEDDWATASKSAKDAVNAISIVDELFLILFTIELGANMIVHLQYSFTDKWLCFDMFTIITSWCFDGITIMRSFRIFRVFRLFGRVPALKRIIGAIASTSADLSSIVLVLFILFYIFAVMFTQLFKDCWKDCCYADDYGFCLKQMEFEEPSSSVNGVNYFGRLDYTCLSLFFVRYPYST